MRCRTRRPAQVDGPRPAAQPGRLDHDDRPQPRHRPLAPRVAWTRTAERGGAAFAGQRRSRLARKGRPRAGRPASPHLHLLPPGPLHGSAGGAHSPPARRRVNQGGRKVVPGERTAQRLARAKRKIKAARIPYRVPEEHELPDRLRPVLAVVYLVYNAGLTSTTDPDLCSEAIWLARILATLLPDEPEVAGLLALLLLTESRRASRTRPDSSLVLLGEQDRRRWNRALIEEGQAIVRQCLRRNQPGAYQLQAAINAVHADATTLEQTDWSQILALYDQLLALAPTPVVALNRAIAIGEVRGASAALALVDELDLDNYHPFHATRADLLRRLRRNGEAAAANERAAALAPTDAEQDFLKQGGRGSR